MREILFKAKRIDNGEWMEGYYFYNPNIDKHFIHTWLSGGLVEVEKDTICQYTGLIDKNGNRIWENDVALRTSSDRTFTGKIVYDRMGSLCHKDFETNFEALTIGSECNIEVIGNIFDNPYQYKKE